MHLLVWVILHIRRMNNEGHFDIMHKIVGLVITFILVIIQVIDMELNAIKNVTYNTG